MSTYFSALTRGRWTLVFLSTLSAAVSATGEPVPKPSGRVILTVQGNVSATNAPGRVDFDRATLEALGVSEVTTTTIWTDGEQHFEGVLASDVLEAVGADGTSVVATALNDYAVEIPMEHFTSYPIMFALKRNGQYMRVRDKGPIWVIYPKDDFQALAGGAMDRFWVWQLRSLVIK